MTKRTHFSGALALAFTLVVLGLAVSAKPLSADNDNTISRAEAGRLDLFLDSHPDIARALQANPALATSSDFVSDHPTWKAFLEDHPIIREDLQAHPSALMGAEDRFDAAEARQDRGLRPRLAKEAMSDQFAAVDKFLDQHPTIAKELEANPSLIKQKDYVADHPELEAFLKDKPALRDSLVDNPQAFMKGVATVDAAEVKAGNPTMPPTKAPPPPRPDADGLNRSQIGALDTFLDSNPGLAKQLQANPSLINNDGFLKDNPDLANFLQSRPDLALDWKANPSAAMTDLRRMDQLEAARSIGNARPVEVRTAVKSFDNFLDNHPVIATEIDHHSSLAINASFIDSHPELKDYLQRNPGVAAELRNNPQSFMTLVGNFDQKETPRTEKKEGLKPKLAKMSH